MKLLTNELINTFNTIGCQEGVEDPIIVCKFFDPCSQWTWFATEYYPDEELFFGLVQGIESELGYFSLKELQSYRGPLGLGVERDLYFNSCKLSELKGLD